VLIPVDVGAGSVLERRRLGWLRIAGIYCAGLGVLHLVGLLVALHQAKQIAPLTSPWWLYATSYTFPIARVVSGIFLLLRSRVAGPLTILTGVCAANALFILPTIWERQHGFELQYAPIQLVLTRLDFVVLLVIVWATFRWKAHGLLRSKVHAGNV
jgi:hypothetical protein